MLIKETINNTTKVDKDVASKIGMKTDPGSAAHCSARYINIVIGKIVTADVFKTKNKICALLALTEEVLISCKSFIAFSPIGVAALSRPIIFAAKLVVIDPNAGWFAGTSGINLPRSGDITLAST